MNYPQATPDPPTSLGQPVRASATFEAIAQRVAEPHPEADARAEEWERLQERRIASERRAECVTELQGDLGERFYGCRLSNYEVYDDEQRQVWARLKSLAVNVVDHITAGRGLFLYGPSGTGKDHLAVALLHIAAKRGLSARVVNGIRLFDDVATAWRDERSESDVVGPLLRPDVLLISDPVLPSGITASNQRTLYRLVSARYDRGRSTWCTLNVAGADQAVELLGRQVYDRLIDNALRLHCNWPSYREMRRIT